MDESRIITPRFSKILLRICCIVFCLALINTSWAQEAPAGVNLSSNNLWLSADYGVTIDASNGVVEWENRMGIDNLNMIGVGANKPTYETSAINGLPTISFNDDLLESSGFLSPDYFPSVNEATFFIVTKADNTAQTAAIFGTYPLLTNRFSAHLPWSNRYYFDFGTCCGGAQRLTDTYANVGAVAGTYYIWGANFNGSGRTAYLDNSSVKTTTLTGTFNEHSIKKFQIGGEGEDPYGQAGDIAEFILYSEDLNDAQRIIINNYLAAKYNLTISDDYYTDATYIHDVIGIGTDDGTNKHSASGNGSSGLGLAEANATLNSATEYLFAGHDNTTNTSSVANLGAGVQERWLKDWRIEKTGTIDAQISFDFSEGINGLYPQNSDDYLLLRLNAGTYEDVGIANVNKSISGDKIIFDVSNADLTNGYYTLGTANQSASPVFGKSLRTWYSYQSGNWNDPNTWTLDGGVTPIYDNAGSEIPSADEVVNITSGRVVTIQPTTNNLSITEIDVAGELDLTTSSGHDFNKITGNGVISTQATTDNFPDGDVTEFADESIGGTFRINGGDVTLSTDREFNNIEIDLVLATNIVTYVANYNVNGTLTVTNGIMQINDGSNTAQLNLNLNDVLVDANGQITVGTASTIGTFSIPGNLPTVGNFHSIFHRVNIYGDFTNNGSVRFTNQSVPDYSQYYNGGAATVYFKGDDGKVATLNGTTDFYNVVIDKGSDKTYVFEINSSSTSNFALYGSVTATKNETSPYTAENPEVRKALWIKNGTLKLTGDLNIPTLTEGSSTNSNYVVPANGGLWIAGSGVTVRGTALTSDTDVAGHVGVDNSVSNNALLLFGNLTVSDGTYDLGNAEAGIAYRATSFPEILIEGGIVTAVSLWESGASGQASYTQTGGVFNLTGVGTANGDFDFDGSDVTFNMSGGEIILDEGDLLIGSNPGNYNVTGGTVTFNMSEDAVINSTANLWNVTLNAQSGTRTLVMANDLIISNDLVINTNTILDSDPGNDFDLTIGADFTITSGGVYTANSNTTTIDGDKVTNFNLGGLLTFNDLVINKDDEAQLVEIDNGAATAIQIDGTFTHSSGVFDYKSFVINAKAGVSISDTIGVSGETGQLLLDGSSSQTITSNSGVIGNLEIDNANGVGLIGGSLTVFETLTMTNGIFDINTEQLIISEATGTIAGSGFGTTKMIQTDGNASDGGLSMYVDANESITYPIGTDANAVTRYTPVSATFTNFSDDGYVAISVADEVLHTTVSGGGNILSYYWRVAHSDFMAVPRVTYDFVYNETEDDDSNDEGNFSPGKVLDEAPFTRSTEIQGNVNTGSNTITFDNSGGTAFDVENANYTAGVAARFVGAPTVYYSRRHQIGGGGLTWTDVNDWSTDGVLKHGGAAAAGIPGPGDIVVIGAGQINGSDEANDTGLTSTTARHQMVAGASRTVTEVIFDSNPAATAIGNNLSRIRLTQTTRDLTAGKISGHGELMIAVSSSDESVVTGDMGDFISNDASSIFYDIRSGGTVSISNLTDFPGVRFYGNNNSPNVSFANDITASSFLIDRTSNLEVRSNMTVDGDVRVGNNGDGHITFPNDGSNNTLSIGGDLLYTSNTSNTLTTENAGSDVHTLSVAGDITLTTATTFDLSTAGTNTILELSGTGINTFTNSSGASPDLYQIVMNKGTDQSSTFSFDDDFTISTPTASIQPIVMQNGTLIINDAAIGAGDDLVLTNATNNLDFNIPASAALQISAGKAILTGTDIGITLDGLLQIDGTGELDMSGGSNNYIEYSTSGSASITVGAGTLTVGSQIRRSTIATTGVLNYTQTGGTVVVGQESAPEEDRGVFEVLNTGSNITLTGGDFTIVRQNGSSPTVASVYINPETSDFTGSTITIGNTDTPASQTEFNLNIAPAINDLVFAGSNTPTSKLDVRALMVNGDITINSGHAFNANGFDLSLGGDFVNNGTYTGNGNTTTFSGTSTQDYSGSGSETFYDVLKDNTSSLTFSKAVTIAHDLTLSDGDFSTGTNAITLEGNAEIDIDVSSTSGSGLVFQGASEQFLSRSASGSNTIDILTIDNGLGVTIPSSGYSFTIDDNLRLSSGKLNIGSNLLTLSGSCDIEEVNPFSDVNMIQTNSSFADNGVLKLFPAIGSSTSFIFPVGESIYTPVDFAITNMDQGDITVRPANEMHISIIEDTEAPDAEITDANNALQYHWVVDANDITSLTGTATFTFDASDAIVSGGGYTLSNYIPAILLDATTAWDKAYGTADFDEGANNFTITMSGVGDAGIAGVYTAGVGVDNSDNPINGAIPDNITLHETLGTSIVGDYDDAGTWTTSIPSGGPIGGQITVKSGDELVLNNDNVRLSRTVIESGATLTVDETTQHRLGTVTGTGTLKITSSTTNANFPAGDYSDFFSCSGGGLEYAGTGNYSVMSGLTSVRNLTLSGSGNRNISNNDITICEDLTLNGPTLNNSSNRAIDVTNDFIITSGTFNAGTGTIDINGDVSINGGTFNTGNGGITDIFGDLNLTSGTFNVGSGGRIDLRGDLSFIGGTFDGGSNTSLVRFKGSSLQNVSGNFTGANSFYRLRMHNSGGISLSDDIEVQDILTLTSGIIETNGNDVILGSSITVSPAAGSSSSFIDGKVLKTLTNAGDDFTFPIGKNGRWRYTSVNDVSIGGEQWEAEYFWASPTSHSDVDNLTPTDGSIQTISNNEYWVISDGNVGSIGMTAKIGLSWDGGSDVSSVSGEREQLEVMVWNDAASTWDNFGGANFSGSHTQSAGSFQSSSLLSFSQNIVTLGSSDAANPLPITLQSFSGYATNSGHHLEWVTSSEINNDRFELERSFDGQNFEVIAKIDGAGTTSEEQRYSYTEANPYYGKNYYRLKQVDVDGVSLYVGDVVLLENNDELSQLAYSLFPNPTDPSNINLNITTPDKERSISVSIYDIYGRSYYEKQIDANGIIGDLVSIQLYRDMKSGVYLMVVEQGDYKIQKKLMIK